MIQNEQLKELINKYREGQCSDEEIAVLENWYLQWNETDRVSLSEDELTVAKACSLNTLVPVIALESSIKLGYRIAAVAVILLVIGSVIFFYSRYTNTLRHPGAGRSLALAGNDIKPGGNKAYLTLANGKRLSLTDAANGALAKEAGVEISKAADGRVVYEGRELASTYSNALNTIETPKGGQYQVHLPDGTKIWLNAASKLIYPVTFNGREERRVELSGEAYFEVAKDKAHPFKVKSNTQEVQVLGTHFNINSYVDEPTTKTTLLEGSVKVNNVLLRPGQQTVVLKGQSLKITEVNPDDAIAWKNGTFVFESEPIQTIMRKIARWYDVDVEYKRTPNVRQYTGTISRTENISQILALLEKAGNVKFEITAKKIIVK